MRIDRLVKHTAGIICRLEIRKNTEPDRDARYAMAKAGSMSDLFAGWKRCDALSRETKSNEETNDMAKNMANGSRMPRSFEIRSPHRHPDIDYRRPFNCISDDGERLSKNHPLMATRLLLFYNIAGLRLANRCP
jgi:hypothetical protein